jgi:glyoxylase-like metal-dependent hydrolase (beta-lactamase superfamily II)
MTRTTVLAILLGLGGLAAVTAQAPAPNPNAPKVLDAEKLKDNLYVLRNPDSGGNTAVFVTTDGVVIVDTKLPGWGRPIIDKVKELTNKPITTIINTHTHYDHVSGNVEFPATVDVVVQENTKANMDRMGPVLGREAQTTAPSIFKTNDGRGLPKRTFKDRMTLGKGADQIDLYYFGRGHTNGDAFVVFPALRVMHAGDIFARKGPPLLDANNGGSGVMIGDTLSKAHAGIRNVDQIITGHSTVMTWPDLKEYSDYNKEFIAWVQLEMKTGKSVDEAAAEYAIPPTYKGYTPNPAQTKTNIGVVYNELKK